MKVFRLSAELYAVPGTNGSLSIPAAPLLFACPCSINQLNRLSNVWHWSNSFSGKKKESDL